MKKNFAIGLSAALAFILACSVVTGQATQAPPPPANPPTYTPLPTYTPYPTNPVEPTSSVEPTTEAGPTAAALPTVTPPILPQQWAGLYNQTGYGKVGIQLLIESMKENTFKGKMLWLPTQWYNLVINRMNGEYVQDFGNQFEQGRWSKHPDFQLGIGNGTWLKWTETETISGNTIFTMNGWYYGHIRTDGSMAGIYYFNATETTPASDSWELHLKR